MATNEVLEADVVVVGGGLAGIVTALELLDAGKRVLVLDRDEEERFGGLAKEAFGGMFFVGTPEQKRLGIPDSVDLALDDWLRAAELGPEDHWPRVWAEAYVHRSLVEVYWWLRRRSVRYFPVLHWAERGLNRPGGNSLPRFHMVWGTGAGLVDALRRHLFARGGARLDVRYGHAVRDLVKKNGAVTGCAGVVEKSGEEFEARAGAVVIAAGGVGGSLERVRREWPARWGEPPRTLLNGSHRYATGEVHDLVVRHGGNVTHLEKMWNYPEGIRHPRPDRPDHGLRLVPPRSGLWMGFDGRRIGPTPLVYNFDTYFITERILAQPKKYSWHVMNWKMAVKELAVSGAEHNPAIRDKKLLGFVKTVLFGNRALVQELVDHCPDFVSAGSVKELADRMNALQGDDAVNAEILEREIRRYDDRIARGPKYHADDQLRRIAELRRYRGDRSRTCNFQRILDPAAMPLLAARLSILSRKSLGGIQTDDRCRVLRPDGEPIEGLYAVGEAAGFGGGGYHGLRSLEGTFLGGCVLTGRACGQAIANDKTVEATWKSSETSARAA